MSRLTDRISYLQGLAEGMKLNPEKDSHRLIIGILEVLGEVGESFEALAASHGELSDYVESTRSGNPLRRLPRPTGN